MVSEPGKITERITRFFFDQSTDYFLDKEVLSRVIAQMVKFIATKTQSRKHPSEIKSKTHFTGQVKDKKHEKPRKEKPMFFELRQYRIKRGKMKQWVKFTEEVLLPFQISQGMVVVGSFVGQEEKDLYVWIRRFENEQERKSSTRKYMRAIPG